MSANELIDNAFAELARSPGFTSRPDQTQLARLISDCTENGSRGLFEAPTGLGKSLATLIPAIAHALISGKRTIISTYTNVLAEQYWRSDLPLALSLFPAEFEIPKCQYLIGRQRYVCQAELAAQAPSAYSQMKESALLGIESEFRDIVARRPRELTQLWQTTSTPPVCPGRLCSFFGDCYYYKARRGAEHAKIVITNHNVVLQDALLRQASDGELGMLGDFDMLILDEAHDFPQAALNALEFELSDNVLRTVFGIAAKLEGVLMPLAHAAGAQTEWKMDCESFRIRLDTARADLQAIGIELGRSGILSANPDAVWKHPQVALHALQKTEKAKALAADIADAVAVFVKAVEINLRNWRSANPEMAQNAKETAHNYALYIGEFGAQSRIMLEHADESEDVAVAYATSGESIMLRRDTIGLEQPLRKLIWDRTPYVALSATLALDGRFDFFKRLSGAEPDFEEVLPTPFDYSSQAAVYLPRNGVIPDPALARKSNTEPAYFDALARELETIIKTVGGRTLALFHSRREMEAVYERMEHREETPIYFQRRTGVASVGDKFREETAASLFALRSYWTGFDAPGPTLSCVVLVRIPFEVPIDPPQVARMAWLHSQGLNPFAEHTLPVAKMMMRQGAGRLIRRADDHGLIAILDPRVTSKGYGDEIIANLPAGIRTYRDLDEAALGAGLFSGGALL